jgi:hypothetical protein
LSPIATDGEMTTFWPMLHRAPIRAPGMTCVKCQIFVSSPIVHPASM